jgi:hypothetical protein
MTDRQWIEEDRPEIAERIVDGMVSEYTLEQLRQYVWDSLYDQIIFQEWPDLWMYAERYAPELTENDESE